MYFSLQMHQLNPQMPGGLRWYANWNVNEERIQGDTISCIGGSGPASTAVCLFASVQMQQVLCVTSLHHSINHLVNVL